MATVVGVIATVVMAGAAVYSAMNQPGAPNIPPPPKPAGAVYDDKSTWTRSVQKWDEANNRYVTTTEEIPDNELTPEQLKEKQQYYADKEKLSGIRTQMLDNLNKTPEDRLKAYENYKQAFSDQAHGDVDDRYDQRLAQDQELMEARGMTGSRADVDLRAERGKEKSRIDTDIAEKAVLAGESLAKADRDYYTNTLNMIDAGQRSDAVLAYQKAGITAREANEGSASTMASYWAGVNTDLAKWNSEMERNKAMTSAYSGAAGGLGSAYLYGGLGGKSPVAPKGALFASDSAAFEYAKSNPYSQRAADLVTEHYYG